MGPIQLEPNQVAAELSRFGEKLAKGMKVLKEVPEVHYGASDKQEIYREDKVVVYRFTSKHKVDAQDAAADRLRAGQSPLHGRSAGRPLDREEPARVRPRRVPDRLGLSRRF